MATAALGAAPEDLTQKRVASEKLLAALPAEAQPYWESLGDGALRHKPSGLVCPYEAQPLIPFITIVVQASPPPQDNALCSYSTADASKSTQLVATKVAEGTPVAVLFASMRNSMMEKMPDMKSLGRDENMLIPGVQMEAFSKVENGKPCLLVFSLTVVKGWAVWSMTTIPNEKQDAFSVHLLSLFASAAFDIGATGVTRTAQGIPEPQINPK